MEDYLGRTSPPIPVKPLPGSHSLTHRHSRSSTSRFSTSSSITTLPEYTYTTSPPSRAYGRSSGSMQEWPPPSVGSGGGADIETLPGYRSPPAEARAFHRHRSSVSKYPSELASRSNFSPESLFSPERESEPDPFSSAYTSPHPPRRRISHRRHPSSTSTWRSVGSADEEVDGRLEQLVERSVKALEMSNALLSHSFHDGQTMGHHPPNVSSRRRERMGGFRSASGRWTGEHITEEAEDETADADGETSAWDESLSSVTVPSAAETYTGSLPEENFLAHAYRPSLPRMASSGSLSGKDAPSLDGYHFPRPARLSNGVPQHFISSSPNSTLSRSASRTPTRPPPLTLSSSGLDISAPQVSTPSFQPSTPAYRLVSEILSREALQRRPGSQPSTPHSAMVALPIPPSASNPLGRFSRPKENRRDRRDSSADPPAERRSRTLTASISVPQDMGKWIRSLEPRMFSRSDRPPPTETEPQAQGTNAIETEELVVSSPARPKIISPNLPPSPPRPSLTLCTSPPSNGEEPVPLSRSINHLRAILSAQPAPEPLVIAAPVLRRPQFRPVTPQLPSIAITRPPPTPRSSSTPPGETLETANITHGASGSEFRANSSTSPVPSAIRRFRSGTERHGKHVSFSPTPTEIPSRATSPPPEDMTEVVHTPVPVKANKTGWSVVSWLLPSARAGAAAEVSKKDKGKGRDKVPEPKPEGKYRERRGEDELAGLWKARSWMSEGRQGWGERINDGWRV
ncbi:hypothetical protein DACRYDRAFT_113211 [Dacryopinax primogenitus]|uniref:Uncharacterized protein n=1 Tax=Dacryopinax primogenitus (strain DJM 731) TaxID=1858805 RepID=M5GFR4_DACPD|nr:uncharacterized protein DACRYDRAFT_113211 [Dacryopinax primogenitus]EJU06527.1 hypothetical protein DACRYDRAFT_113211 [Dacryopinax primogenitus]